MAFDFSKLLQPGRVALLLSEVQRGVIGDLSYGTPLAQAAEAVGVIPASARLAKAARERGAPVMHCLADRSPTRFGQNVNARLFRGASKRPPGSGDYDPVEDTACPEVWQEGDPVSIRHHGLSPMADNQLDTRLRNAGVDTLILAGMSTNMAIPGMTMEAVNRSYQVVIARDAIAGVPLDYADALIQNTLSLIATVATVDEIIAGWPKG